MMVEKIEQRREGMEASGSSNVRSSFFSMAMAVVFRKNDTTETLLQVKVSELPPSKHGIMFY